MTTTNADFAQALKDIEKADKAVVDLKVRFSGLSINPAGGLETLHAEGSDWAGFLNQVHAAIAHRADVYAKAADVVNALPAELTASLNTQSLIHDINNPSFVTDEWEVEKEQKFIKRIEKLISQQ